jgi:hypothetical protein
MTKRSNSIVQELSLEALETVMGGSAAPMGLGGSIMPSPLHPQAAASSHSGVGYTDHFGLHIGHNPNAGTGAAATAAAGPASAATTAASNGVNDTHASPLGLGANAGATAASNVHGMVNATSAFQMVDQASPQDAQQQDAQSPQSGEAAPMGLGADSQ